MRNVIFAHGILVLSLTSIGCAGGCGSRQRPPGDPDLGMVDITLSADGDGSTTSEIVDQPDANLTAPDLEIESDIPSPQLDAVMDAEVAPADVSTTTGSDAGARAPSLAEICGPLTAALPTAGEPCEALGTTRCSAEGAHLTGKKLGGLITPVPYCMLPNRLKCASDGNGVPRWTIEPCAPLPKSCALYVDYEVPTCRETPAGARCCPMQAFADPPSVGGGLTMCEAEDAAGQPICLQSESLIACQPFSDTAKFDKYTTITMKTCAPYCQDCLYWQPKQLCSETIATQCKGCNKPPCPLPRGWCGMWKDGTVKCAETCEEVSVFKAQAGQ